MKKIFNSEKKAQITIFIILGIILLVSTSVFLYIKQVSIEKKGASSESVYKVPEEAQPVYDYVSGCLRDKTKEALIILGENGGYIYPESAGITGNYMNPTEERGLRYSKHDDYTLPYWLYMSSPNSCTADCAFGSEMPQLKRSGNSHNDNSVESQIDLYLSENLEECLDGFAQFKQAGFTIKSDSQPRIVSIITRNDVTVNMDYSLEIIRGDSNVEINKFVTHTQVRLYDIFELASEIVNKERESGFFEKQAMMLISSYSGIDSSKFPPPSEVDFTLLENKAPTYWRLDEKETQLKTILMSYTPIIRVGTTLNDMPPLIPGNTVGRPATNAMLYNMRIETNKTYDLNVNFNYFSDWKPYFNIRPSSGGIVFPEEGVGCEFCSIIGIGMTKYDFKYDLSYPVLVRVSDPYAFNEEGYEFTFAIEANMRNNRAFTGNQSIITSQPQGSFACDKEQRVSGNITIVVIDGNNSNPIPGAQVYFNFGKESCDIGETILMNGKTAEIKGLFPKGIGKLMVSKEGYLSTMKIYAVKENKTEKVVVELYPVVEKRIVFGLKNLDKQYLNGKPIGWSLNTAAYSPSPDTEVSISFNRIPDAMSSSNFKQAFYISRGADADNMTMKLVPGNYEVKVSVFDYKNVTIPEEKKCIKQEIFGVTYDTDCYIINETNITIFTSTSFNESYPVRISSQNLYNDEPLNVYGIYFNLRGVPLSDRKHEDLEEMQNIDTYIMRYYGQLIPR